MEEKNTVDSWFDGKSGKPTSKGWLWLVVLAILVFFWIRLAVIQPTSNMIVGWMEGKNEGACITFIQTEEGVHSYVEALPKAACKISTPNTQMFFFGEKEINSEDFCNIYNLTQGSLVVDDFENRISCKNGNP